MKFFVFLVILGLIYCCWSIPLSKKSSSTKPKPAKVENVRIGDILKDYWTIRKPRSAGTGQGDDLDMNAMLTPDERKETSTKPITGKVDVEPTPAKAGNKPSPSEDEDKLTTGKGDGKGNPSKDEDKLTTDKAGAESDTAKTGAEPSPTKADAKPNTVKADNDYVKTSVPSYTEKSYYWGGKVAAKPWPTGYKTDFKISTANPWPYYTEKSYSWDDKKAPAKSESKNAGYRAGYKISATENPYYAEKSYSWKKKTSAKSKSKNVAYEADYKISDTENQYYTEKSYDLERRKGKSSKKTSRKHDAYNYNWKYFTERRYRFTTGVPWTWSRNQHEDARDFYNEIRHHRDEEQDSNMFAIIFLSCLLVVFAIVILLLTRKKLISILTGRRSSGTMNSRTLAINVEEARPLMRTYVS